jgi:hypothetical protein
VTAAATSRPLVCWPILLSSVLATVSGSVCYSLHTLAAQHIPALRYGRYMSQSPPPPHTHTCVLHSREHASLHVSAPVCVTHFQCLSCLSCLCSVLVLMALYMASATASMDQGFTLMAPDRLGEHPTNSAAAAAAAAARRQQTS